jgi:small subunit ribosomal protein S3
LGQDGAGIKKLEKDLKILLGTRKLNFKIDVREVLNPDLNAKVVANEIAVSLENRGSFRMAQKKALKRVMKSGAKGIKTEVSGRLNGVDMARSEGYSEGIIPLQTLRNDIDFAIADAHTTYGVLGVKV